MSERTPTGPRGPRGLHARLRATTFLEDADVHFPAYDAVLTNGRSLVTGEQTTGSTSASTGRTDTRADVVVVGAGSAGSVIVRRLIDAGRRVILLEAGGADANPAIHDPARLGEIQQGPDDWDYVTVPQPHAADRRLILPRGKVLGGSTRSTR